MQLSPGTLNILKNFSNINRSIVIKEGSELSTIAITKNIFAKAKVEEYFPKTFAIYDLTEFLSGLTLFKNPEFDFDNGNYLVIRDGHSQVKYFYSDPEIIVAPPQKSINLPSVDVQFILESETLATMVRAANVYQLPDLCVEGDGQNINLVVKDKCNTTSNSYSLPVGETEDAFSYSFKIENIKILPGKYDVSISSKLISNFVNINSDLEYFIALEPDEE
jgi:gp45 sliding clamp, C terminal